MEELFASLAISGVTLAGKAAFNLATNSAMSKLSKVIQESTGQSSLSLQLVQLQSQLSRKLAIVNPSLDQIEFLATRSNAPHLMEIHMEFTQVKQDLSDFSRLALNDKDLQEVT